MSNTQPTPAPQDRIKPETVWLYTLDTGAQEIIRTELFTEVN